MFCKGRSLTVCSDGPFTLYRPVGVPLTGKRIIYTLLPCYIIFAVWTGNVYFLMPPTEEKERIYYDVLKESYNVDSYKVSFISMVYKSPATETEPEHWNLMQLLPFFICCSIMDSCLSTIVWCGLKALKQMKNCGAHMSKKTKELNRQLFLTLGMQTLLPLITMYLPVGSFIFLPFLGIELGANANKTGAFIGLYPALDPLIAILLIKDFRNYVFCRKKALMKVSTTTGNTEKSASTFHVS
ncbi:unnamed protein product [Caenorhabditis brenneri]